MTRLAKCLSVLLLAGLGLFALAAPASAHNSLTSSNPGDEATLDSGPGQVVLTFDQPVQEGEGLNSVAVTGPDGKPWQGGPVEVDSNVVTAPVRELGPKGVYTIDKFGGWSAVNDKFFDPDKGVLAKINKAKGVSTGG